MQAPLMSTNTS